MEAIARSGHAVIAAIADADPAASAAARCAAPDAAVASGLEELLARDLDGLVIATPSALHADQAITALERGCAVFCQKPLGRTVEECRQVIDAARSADRLLGVDLSYRFTEAAQRVRRLVREGELGEVFAADLVFHNAYGPDKPWFYDPQLSGGGCVIDLGIHLVDLALWTLEFPCLTGVSSRLFTGGRPANTAERVEDYAVAQLDLACGTTLHLACSWRLPAGRDAVIEATFYGTAGAASMRNVGGSFYDFSAERWRGTRTETVCSPPDDWGGRAAVAWARALARDGRFDPEIQHLLATAAALDAVYGR
jgi:predicted dehydrogenase